MTKRTLSTSARAVSARTTPAKKSKTLPKRAAAQRASSAVQREARHVESFTPSSAPSGSKPPTKKKEKVVRGKRKSSTAKPARAGKGNTRSLQSMLSGMSSGNGRRGSQVDHVEVIDDDDEDDDVAEDVVETQTCHVADDEESCRPEKVHGCDGKQAEVSEADKTAEDGRGGGGSTRPDIDNTTTNSPRGRKRVYVGVSATDAQTCSLVGAGDVPVAAASDRTHVQTAEVVRNPRERSRKVVLSVPQHASPSVSGAGDNGLEESGTPRQPRTPVGDTPALVPGMESFVVAVTRQLKAHTSMFDEVMFKLTTLLSAVEAIAEKMGDNGGENVPAEKKTRRERGIEGYKSLMSDKFPNVEQFFTIKLWNAAIMYANIEHLWTATTPDFGMVEGMTALCSMLFARTGKKDAFNTGVGKKASTYRFIVLSRAIFLARSGRFPPDGDAQPEKPRWLGIHGKQPFIRDEHILSAQAQHEQKVAHTPEYQRRVSIGNGAEPNDDDCAVYIAARLYDFMNKMFMDHRRRAREDFASFFAYLFKPWDAFPKVCVSDRSIDLRWEVPFEEINRLTDEQIRGAMTLSTKEQNKDRWNKAVYEHMLGNKEMRLLVAHDVIMVKGEGEERKSSSGPRGDSRLYRFWLSMLVPAAVLLMSWSGMPADMPVHRSLAYHPKFVHVLYNVANLLREVFDLHPARAIRNGLKKTDKPSGRLFNGTEEEKALLQSFYDTLVPGKSLFERAMDTATMCIDKNVYDKNHRPTKSENAAAGASAPVDTPARADPPVSGESGAVRAPQIVDVSPEKEKKDRAGGDEGVRSSADPRREARASPELQTTVSEPLSPGAGPSPSVDCSGNVEGGGSPAAANHVVRALQLDDDDDESCAVEAGVRASAAPLAPELILPGSKSGSETGLREEGTLEGSSDVAVPSDVDDDGLPNSNDEE